LHELTEAELIVARGEPPDAVYRFKHALVQDAACESLLRSRRHELHGRIANVLEREYPEIAERQPEVLARHCSEAGLLSQAATYWLRAGRFALSRSANKEAFGHLRRGIEVVERLPPGQERTSTELDLQLGLAGASIASQGYAAEGTERAYLRARELLDAVAGDPRQFAVLYGLFVVHWNHARLPAAVEVATELLERAKRSGDPAPICVGHRSLAVAFNAMGQFGEALQHACLAASCYDRELHQRSAIQYGHDIGVAALIHKAVAEWFSGDAERSAATACAALDLAHVIGHANTLGYAESWVTFLRLSARDMEAVRQGADRLLKLSNEHGMAFWAALGRCMLGGALVGLGKPEEGLDEIDAGLSALDRIRVRIFRPVYLCLKAEALAALGRAEEAIKLIEDALAEINISRERWWEPDLLRIRAELRLAIGGSRASEAVRHDVEASIRVADQQGSRFLGLRARASAERLLSSESRCPHLVDLPARE
jgi:predicted ATPase